MFFKPLRNLSIIDLAFFLQIFRKVEKTAFHMSIGTVSGKTYLSSTYVFFNICGTWAKSLRPIFSKILRRGCQNCILRVQRNSWRKTIFSEKSVIFIHYCTLGRKFLAFFLKNHRTGCENCILRILRNSLRKTIFSEKMCIFYSLSHIATKIFGLLSENFRRCCRDCFQLVHRENKKEKELFEFLYQFETLSKKLLAFFRQTFGGVVKTPLYVSIRTFCVNIFFRQNWNFQTFFGHWAN